MKPDTTVFKITLFLLAVFIIVPCFAQDYTELGSKRIKYFLAEDYNAHSQNWSVFQDKRGMLYFGNNDGVLEYNGVSWTKITAFSVRCFAQGRGKRIYVGGDNEFGYFEPDSNGANRWVSYSKKLPQEYKNYLSVLTIQQVDSKTVFFAFRGIYIYQNDSLIKVIRPITDFRFSFNYKNRFFLRQTGIGLMEFRRNRIYMLAHGDFFADKPVYMFEPYDENHAIIATKQNGLYLVNIKNISKNNLPIDSIYTPFKTQADKFFSTNNIYHGIILSDGNYAIGSTVGGMLIIDKKGHIKRVFNKQTGLPVNNVNFIFNDRENNLWLALNNGIAYIEMNSPMNFFGEESGYQGLVVNAIKFKNKFYIGTLEGLYILTLNTDLSSQNSSFYHFKRLTADYNSFMFLDTIDGKLYAAARYGLFAIDGEKVTSVKKMEFSYVFLHSKKYPSVMYINNSNGLAVFKKNKDIWNYSGLIKGLDHEIRYIYEENDGTIWINGNNNDVLKLTFKNNDFFNPKITTYDSLKGLPNQSSLAIFNAVNYLSVFSPGLGFYRHYSDKLPVGKPDHFYHDPLFPSLMPGTNDSIFYYLATRLNDSTYYALTSEQGMIKIISRRNKPIISIESSWFGQGNSTFFLYPDKENNLLWFSTFKGLYSYNLNKIKTNSIRFITTIQQIVTGKDSVLYQGNDTTLVTDIPFNKNSISLNFAALFFQGSENNTFQYYLKGLDETWSKWTKEKHITYNFLPEGTYTFIVRGKNIYGTISPQTVFKFHILPPWYRTWWAYGLYGITAFLLIIIIVIIYSKQLKSRNIKLEKLVQHRTAQIKQQNSEIELKNLQLNDINKQLEKLSLVASKIENSVLIMDSKAHFEWVNDGFIKLYGYTLEELIKEYSDNLFEYSQHPDINSIINICVNDKIPVTYDAIITNRNKQKIWTHTTLTPILDKDGNVTQIIAIDSDITHLKSIEQQLMEQNEEINSQKDQLEDANRELEKLSIVASETDNTVIIMDKDANFLWINKSLRKKYGADFENIEGKNLIDSSYNPDIKRIVAKCVSEKKTVIYETETKISSEKTIWMQTTLTPILNKNGEIKNIVAIDSDITKLKKAEEKIILQSKELENNLNELEKKNELIVNSIEYARKIQEAFLPSISEFRNIFSDSFVFIKPRDVVSGDFFWVYTAGNMKFVAVADCTGHGVPGAFMSIIGSTILNEIVREKKIYQPSQVLTMLNQGIISALHQNKELQNTQNDGMDIVFCAFNITSKKIVLATTSHMAIVCDGYGVHKINCNLFSIGDAFSARSEVVYNETEINVDKNSQIFLYSDGFHDQFGGPNNTKYMTEPFEEFLASIYKFPVDEQIKKVDKNFRAWKKENKQIDDVLVIGLKFSDI